MNASEVVHSFFILSSLSSTSKLLVRKIVEKVVCCLRLKSFSVSI